MPGAHVTVAIADRPVVDAECRDHPVAVEQMVQGAAGVILPASRPVAVKDSAEAVGNLAVDGDDVVIVFGVLGLAGAQAAQVSR